MEQKELITSLIKDDLINTYLLDNLERIGFYSENYRLNLSDTIFKLLNIPDENEELYELYLEKCSEMATLPLISNSNLLKESVEKVYNMIIAQ